ncbi:Oidioi.mRNA.OKI2018_I69.chr1.g484.t1.cds [Oikopleura dioica]|uniref:Oidioi.mRNA.OKI2018_I69.chr1.g484.t1.cds n=1 Tax=Oikopleura dioica TaxID=34765 RepID=A0ABN7SP88_OIKDI|nr:Oidioi.mRNA.OKI2018_I69.chr1.g484.t1.cds [Oikopleura dioica]
MRLFICFALFASVFSFDREALDSCDDLECLSELMTSAFGFKTAPTEDDGFLATWLWYDEISKALAEKMSEAKMAKRGVGNLYERFLMKISKKSITKLARGKSTYFIEESVSLILATLGKSKYQQDKVK